MSAMEAREFLFTRDDFRRMEAAAPEGTRLERMDGYVYAMAGAGRTHERIVTRLIVALSGAAASVGCEAYSSNRRLSIGKGTDFLPDVSVYCDPTDTDEYAGTRPCLVVEVLSRSTAIDDFNLKVPRYKAIPSLESILFINPEPLYATLYRRTEDGWEQHEFVSADDIIVLPCPPTQLRLGQLL